MLYWMTAARRTRYNAALEHAAAWCAERELPLVVLEPLRLGYPWACPRFHGFVIDGMRANAAALAARPATYYPYVEPEDGAGKGLLAALAARAAVVVTDDYPAFFLPRMLAAAAAAVPARIEAVDSNGLYPIRATDRVFTTAASFRRHLQRELPAALGAMPKADPLARRRLPAPPEIARAIGGRWPPAELDEDAVERWLPRLALASDVPRTGARGGQAVARRVLRRFVSERLPRYGEHNRDLDDVAQSGLSPYLHFGHIGAHEVFAAVMRAAAWSPADLATRPTGSRTGWWGVDPSTEVFLDELVTWRELGFNAAAHMPAYDRFESLPAWAKKTLKDHERDPRPYRYDFDTLDQARTHDELWNAAQRQLVRDGIIAGYLRMLWGKKVLEWSARPREALETLIELNNRYALDGRDPNSYSGIFWVFGRYDRAWGPERPIYGKVRYMASESTARKLDVKGYLARYT